MVRGRQKEGRQRRLNRPVNKRELRCPVTELHCISFNDILKNNVINNFTPMNDYSV